MYQIFEIDPAGAIERISLPEQELTLGTVFALLGGPCRAATRGTPRLDLLLWIDARAAKHDREANPRVSAMLGEVFRDPGTAVRGPLLVTGGSRQSPATLDKQRSTFETHWNSLLARRTYSGG
ncbi:hypothetical protein KDL01_10130 [Actinospica durhamensis]|uniref:Uncharacterized protein n=1 Tax=Actinospica durhamensis TaxID=1508375 RepID=A0A941IR64_9ACTN|nr:hypothetical protein [Actinospica durhamensis]MBR7833623.1 hypothetical protein [Actinospica durhamensis]